MTFRQEFRSPQFEKSGTFFKVDEEQGIAYGWAIVCFENDEPYFDLQGDHIPEGAMVDALLDFSKNSRVGKDQHQGEQVGEHVFLYPMTKATAGGLGIKTAKRGALVGYKPNNPADLQLIKTGERTGFSIGGFIIESDETDIGKAILKAYGASDTNGKKKGRVFRTFKINEISLVDRPAQEGATVGIVKRHVIAKHELLSKEVLLTSVEDGHQHVVFLDRVNDDDYSSTTYDVAGGATDDTSHNHRVLLADGKVVISTNAGHGHTVAVPADWQPPVVAADTKPNQPGVEVITARAPVRVESSTSKSEPASVASATKEPLMTTPEETAILKSRAESAEARASRAEKLAELTDMQKLYFGKLGPTDQAVFLAKSIAERGIETEASIVHKSADTVFFKNDDQRLVSAVKANEAMSAQLAASQTVAKRAEYIEIAKRDMMHYAGEDDTVLAIVEAVSGIKDEKVRKAAFDSLRAANAAVLALTTAQGHANLGKSMPGSPEDEFYKARDAWAQKNSKDMGSDGARARATKEFMATQEGAPLYKAYVAGQPARA